VIERDTISANRPGVIDWDGFRRGALEAEALAAGEAFRSGLADADERALS
jgi:hypothetical protein